MYTLQFGPGTTHTVSAILCYTSHRLNLDNVAFMAYDEDEDILHTIPSMKGDTYTIDNVSIWFEKVGKPHPVDRGFLEEINGTLKGESELVVKTFIKTALDFYDNFGLESNQGDTIKILNFDYCSWVIEATVKKRYEYSVQLPKKLFQNFREDFQNFLKPELKQKYSELQIPRSRIYLFYGPPGTGKTSLIQCIASEHCMNIATVIFDEDMDDKTFKKCLKKVPKNTLVCIEDVDCIFEDRKAMDSHKNRVSFSGILNAIDGVDRLDELIVIITTNFINKLDDALKRRVDYFIQFKYCNKEQIVGMFNRFYPDHGDLSEKFWEECKGSKITPNVLQKYFTKNLMKPNLEDVKEFVNGEHKISEEHKNLYT
jgi:hypothetical protein